MVGEPRCPTGGVKQTGGDTEVGGGGLYVAGSMKKEPLLANSAVLRGQRIG